MWSSRSKWAFCDVPLAPPAVRSSDQTASTAFSGMIRHGIVLFAFLSLVPWTSHQVHAVEEDAHNRTSTWSFGPGCNKCAYYRCPGDLNRCQLGSVPDPCGCCPNGLCARLAGESCWNSTLDTLAAERRNDGFCAQNYQCQLRTDLHTEDEPEAICVCLEQGYACGSNNVTYSTPCELFDTAQRAKSSSLTLQHLGPCPSRPEIQKPRRFVVTESVGRMVSIDCDVRGFPLPEITWRFRSSDGRTFFQLPATEHDAVINSIDGPDPLTRISSMQLGRVAKHHQGSYECIASNPSGEDALDAYLDVVDSHSTV